MSAYLTGLRGLTRKNCHLSEPSKPSKLGFEGFEGDQSSRFSWILAALQMRCADFVETTRWQQAVRDGESFFTNWGQQEPVWDAGAGPLDHCFDAVGLRS